MVRRFLLAVVFGMAGIGIVRADDAICLGGNCGGADRAVLVGSSISASSPADQLVFTAGGGVLLLSPTSAQFNGTQLGAGGAGASSSFAGSKATSSVDMAGFAVVGASAVSLSGTSGSSISTTNDQLTVQTVGGVLQVNNSSWTFNNYTQEQSTKTWTGENTYTGASSFTALVSGATTAIFSRIGVGAVDGNPLANVHVSTNQSQGVRVDYTGASANGAATIFLSQNNGSAGALNDIFGSYGFYSTTGAATNGIIQIGGAVRATGAGTWNNGSAPTDVTISNVPSGSLVLTERMRVRSTGNVGIGTNAPATKIDVFNGSATIRGTSAGLAITQDAGQKLEALLVVSTGTTRILEVNSGSVTVRGSFFQDQPPADYVFKPGYDLLPIEAVESHIKQYGHLPTYSSGADISGGKVSSGEFNRQTQETVENMALYIIELKKEIELLKRK